MKLFLLLLLSVHFISAKKRQISSSNEELQNCFDHGISHGQKIENSCHDFPKSLKQENFPKICAATFTMACLSAHRKLTCNKGIESAKLNGNCKHDHHSEEFKKCCNACKLGIEIGSTLSTCSELKNFLFEFDAPIPRVVKECCQTELEKPQELKMKVLDEMANLKDDIETPIASLQEKPEKNIKMCSTYTSLCNENENCIEIDDSYVCECKNGFSVNSTSNQCEDIDECASTKCELNEVCVNTFGSFYCDAKCKKGFEVKEFSEIDEDVQCVDIDECQTLKEPCEDGKLCENLKGSYKCIEMDVLRQHCTNKNFEIVDGECIDRNECLKDENVCGKDEICTNLWGNGYRCEKIECKNGYKRFLNSHCRRNICRSYDANCRKLPSHYFHFFKAVSSSDINQTIFNIEPFNGQDFKNYESINFDQELFEFEEKRKSAQIILLEVPKEDTKIEIEIEVEDKIRKHKNKQINIYYVYVEKPAE